MMYFILLAIVSIPLIAVLYLKWKLDTFSKWYKEHEALK